MLPPTPPVAGPLVGAPVVQNGFPVVPPQALASPPAPPIADCDPPAPPSELASPPLHSTGLLGAAIALLSHVLECPAVPLVASPELQTPLPGISPKTVPQVGLKGS